MKIGITCYPTYGGSGVLATELGKKLADQGHEIHFISYALPYRLKGFYRNVYFHEVQVSSYPLFEYQPYTLSLAVKMYDVIREFELDLLHVHYAIPHATSAWIASEMLGDDHPVKILTTLHGTDITLVGQEESFKSITRFSIERSDGVTVVSRYLHDQTIQALQVGSPIEIIPNFVDTEVFKRRGRSDCSRDMLSPDGSKVIIHISNMRPVKCLPDVIRVFANVSREIKARLVMVGDGPERAAAHRLAEELGVGERVVFLGAQESIASLLNCADLALQPSSNESFGLSILEALSTGVPVISTRCGGPEEVVLDGECGYLSAVGDVDEMSANALKLLSNDDLYESFSRVARQHVVEHFTIQKITAKYLNFYRSILCGRQEAGREG
ncbi:MAG: N-acetyl-alpha-D-glucosaminyl L-malate synthase BshA [Candidatus Glassbacteria bacterium]|nr:N-acetyl-alpha-D-glucosaminyl L-malate synthase BshA [Candidatus Glassbacteria bacterium]